MSIRCSPRKPALLALHRAAPTRTPIVTAAYLLGSYIHHRQTSASRRPPTSRRSAVSVTLIDLIDATHLIPSVQIPIAHRRC
jgi:hypothetical protein